MASKHARKARATIFHEANRNADIFAKIPLIKIPSKDSITNERTHETKRTNRLAPSIARKGRIADRMANGSSRYREMTMLD